MTLKKLTTLALAIALLLLLGHTNPNVGDFVRYYESGTWQTEQPLLGGVPQELLGALAQEGAGTIRRDLYIASIYDFGGWRFLGVAGGFYVLTAPADEGV